MANYSYTVDSYVVFLYGGPDGNSGADATVSLTVSGGDPAYVFLRFYPDGADLPDNIQTTHRNGNLMFYLSYRYDQLSNAIDILRNESPIRFFFNGTSNAGYIATGSEAVGDGEE